MDEQKKFCDVKELKLKLFAIRVYHELTNTEIANLLSSKNDSIVFCYESFDNPYFPKPQKLFKLLQKTNTTYDWLYFGSERDMEKDFLEFYSQVKDITPGDVKKIKTKTRRKSAKSKKKGLESYFTKNKEGE